MDTGMPTELGQFLTFFVAGEEYALDILQVREIIEYDVVTRVPGTPPWIRGVINLRGSVVPVIDLALKFGQPLSEVTKKSCIVIVELRLDDQTTVTGILADAVSQVMELGRKDITPPPAFGTRARIDFLAGMARAAKKFVLVLDIDRVLSASEVSATVAAGNAPAPGAAGVGEAATAAAEPPLKPTEAVPR